MPARLAEILPLKKRTAFSLFAPSLFALLFFFAASSFAQTATHSPGWVVLPVDEYRTLHAKAYPIERDPEPPPAASRRSHPHARGLRPAHRY